jgi:NADH-quinone oxidoreductase subunit A
MDAYLPIAALWLFATIFGTAAVGMSLFLGIKRPGRVKRAPYESGIPAVGEAHARFSVRYYLIGILFIVFDVEIIFLYPWAVIQRRLGVSGLVEIVVFSVLLAAAFVYAWRKGALEWTEAEVKTGSSAGEGQERGTP